MSPAFVSKIFVLGNAGVDLSLALPHLVRPGETVVATGASRAPGGKGLNQAVAAARAGAGVTFLAPVGEDADAAYVAEVLAAEKLAVLHLIPKPHPTDRSIVMVAPDGENCIASIGFCADAVTAEEAAQFASGMGASDWLLLQGNLAAAATIASVRATAGRVMLNAAPLRWPVGPMLPYCTVLVVNRVEAEAISGTADAAEAAAWLHAQGCAAAIVTLGADGCLWADATGLTRRPAPAVRPVDTSGAGDVFCGVLVAGLAAGATLAKAIPAAQAAAAVSVTRFGAFDAIPAAAELSSASAP
jgi:ribokinase